MRKKKITHCHWINAKTHENCESACLNYTKARNKVKTMMRRQSKRRFEKDITRKSKSSPKAFWAHVRRRLKTRSGVTPLLENVKDKDSMKFKDEEKANILQNEFSRGFTRGPEGEIPTLCNKTKESIRTLRVTQDMVKEEITAINANKSCGPDNIYPRLLKELIYHISHPIALLLNKTMEDGEIPEEWKQMEANVSPIFKKSQKHLAENYQHKLMETFVKQKIMAHLINLELFSSKQFGFISGRSTTTQLLNYLDKCIEVIVNGGVVDSIYQDV